MGMSDDLQRVKMKIYNDDKVEEILELLGCWNIDTEQHGLLYVAGLPDGDNPRSVQIKNNESLTCNIRSKGVTGSIFDLISFVLFNAETPEERTSNLFKSKKWVCEKLNYYEFIDDFYRETGDQESLTPNINAWLHKLNKNKTKKLNYDENIVLDDSELLQFGNIAYKGWYEEGINISTQLYFGIGIDNYSQRVTFPIHNKNGGLIGVKGRYCGNNQHIEDNYKYLYLLKCNKSIELYNLHRAIPHIKEKKEIIIVEGAKTTWLLSQWGYQNCVSIEGDSLSDVQVKLIKDLGIDIKVVFALDKDKTVKDVKIEADKVTGRMKYGIIDKDNLMKGKASPGDFGKDVWKFNYENNNYIIN